MHEAESPRVDDAGMERRLEHSPAPRVTLADLNANIVHTEIVTHISAAGQILRWAILTTRSGFAVTGRPSAAVNPENDDAALGERIAVENARQELWPLMGYALRERMYAEPRKYTAAVDPAHGNDKAAVCVASQDASGDTIVHSIHHPEG